MALYNEEGTQSLLFMAGYNDITNGNPSWFVSAVLYVKTSLNAGILWNNVLDQMPQWVICFVGLYIPQEILRGNLAWQGFAGGLKGAAVDNQSFSSWWSGPRRGQWSVLWKTLVQYCLSTLPPCWLCKTKVLFDRLQAPSLFCFVCLFPSLILVLVQKILGGLEGNMIGSWLLSCTLGWGLAHVQLCLFFPGHIPIIRHTKIPVSGARALCRAWWLRSGDRLRCRHLFDRLSQLQSYTCWRRCMEVINLTLSSLFCSISWSFKRQKQDGTHTRVLDLQCLEVLTLHQFGASQ